MRCTLVAVAFVALLSVALCEDGGDGNIDDAGNVATCMDHTNANACGNDEACKWDGDACQDDFSGGPTGTLSLCCPAVVQARLPKVLLLLFYAQMIFLFVSVVLTFFSHDHLRNITRFNVLSSPLTSLLRAFTNHALPADHAHLLPTVAFPTQCTTFFLYFYFSADSFNFLHE